jgi:hypothetical protein
VSIACYKNYSMVVNPSITVPQEYWRLDSLSGGKYVGSIAGVQVTPSNTAIGSGIISNGIEAIGGSFVTATSAGNVALALGTIGASLSCWFKQVNAPHVPTLGGPEVDIKWTGGSSLILYFNYSNDPPVIPSGGYDNGIGGGAVINGPSITVGNWYFLVVTFELATKNVSFYINGSLVSTSVSTTSQTAKASGSLSYFGTIVGNAGEDNITDEIGYWGNHVLTAGEVTTLYNGGVGARPPGA